jgi:hypothetical protein
VNTYRRFGTAYASVFRIMRLPEVRELLDPEDTTLGCSEMSLGMWLSTLCNCPEGMNSDHNLIYEETSSVLLNLRDSCQQYVSSDL